MISSKNNDFKMKSRVEQESFSNIIGIPKHKKINKARRERYKSSIHRIT